MCLKGRMRAPIVENQSCVVCGASRKTNRAAQNRGCLAARGIVRMYSVGLRGISGATVYCGRAEICWTLKEQVSLVSEIGGVIWRQVNRGFSGCQAVVLNSWRYYRSFLAPLARGHFPSPAMLASCPPSTSGPLRSRKTCSSLRQKQAFQRSLRQRDGSGPTRLPSNARASTTNR